MTEKVLDRYLPISLIEFCWNIVAKLYKEKIKEESVVTKSESLDADVKPVILENGKGTSHKY